MGLIVVAASLAIVPSVAADPAAGPGAVSRATAGDLPAGVIPDGTCAARVTAVGGGGASSPTGSGFGGLGGAGASITATFDVLPGQTYQGSVGGGGGNPAGGTGNGAAGFGGTGGTIVNTHRGGGGGGRTTVDLGGTTVVLAGGGGGGGGAHQAPTAGGGGGGGFTGIGAGTVAPGSDGRAGVDIGATANGGAGGQVAAGGAGGTNTADAAQDGAPGTGVGVGTGGNGGPDPNYDSGGGGGGGYTGGGGGASTINQNVTGAGGGGGSSWVAATSPVVLPTAPTSISGGAGAASPISAGPGATGSIAIDWLPCLYGLSVTKSVSTATVHAGGQVTWTVTVTNDGPDPMSEGDTVGLTDLLPDGPNGAPAPAFEVTSIGVSGGTNTDMSRGPVTCTGVAIGSSMPSSTTCSRDYSAPGAPQAPSGGQRGLDPDETLTITYTQIIANTAPCATITNTATVIDRATATGTTDTVGVTASKSASESLTIECYDLAIAKVASPAPNVGPGGTITWTVTVTNNGPADMEGPVATDANPLVVTDVFPSADTDAPSLVSASGPAGSCSLSVSTITCASGLPADGEQVLTFTQDVSAGASDGTVITNTASVSDPTTGDTNDSSTDQTTVRVASLDVTKSATVPGGTANVAGETIGYTIEVENTGGVTLTGVTVDDPLLADEDCDGTPGAPFADSGLTIAVGETLTCTGSHDVTQAELDSDGGGDGDIDNTVTADSDQTGADTAGAAVPIDLGPGLSLVKSAGPTTFAAVGDVITYTYLVTNSGNVTLDGPVTVTDDKATVACPTVTSLDPGDDVSCTATYSITQADLDAGSVTNTATASADGVESSEASATVNATLGPGLSLVKSASPTTFAAVGDVITYTYLVTNSGNVTLDGPVTVTDDKATVACPTVTSLDPGDDVSCTATYSITQADLDAGSVTNTATASADGVESTQDVVAVTTGAVPATSMPTLPPTDTAAGTDAGRPSPGPDWLIAAWLLAVSIGVLTATRRSTVRSGVSRQEE